MNACTILRIWPLLLATLQLSVIGIAHGEKENEVPVIAVDGTILGSRPLTLDGRIWYLKFSTDSQSLYAAAVSSYQIDWKAKQAKPIWQRSERESMVRALFSPNDAHFARMENGNRVHLHDRATGKLLQSITSTAERPYNAAAWSPDSSLIAIGGRGEILIHRVDNGVLQLRIPQGISDISSVAWSPDGKWIVASNRGDLKEDRILLHALDGSSPPIMLPDKKTTSDFTRFSFSPDSTSLAVSRASDSRDSLYFWDIQTKAVTFRHERSSGFNGITHSADGNWLAAGGLSNLLVLDARTGKEIFRNQDEGVNVHVWSVAFSPDSRLLAYGAEDRVKILDTKTWKELVPSEDSIAPVNAVAFSADGRHLVTGAINGDLVLWDWEKQTPVWKRASPPESWGIRELSIDPSGRWIAVKQPPRRPVSQWVSLVDIATGKTRKYLSVSNGFEVAPLFSPSGSSIWLAVSGPSLVEWDINEDRLLRTLPMPLSEEKQRTLDSISFDSENHGWIRWDASAAGGRIDPDDPKKVVTFESSPPLYGEADPIPPRSLEWTITSQSLLLLPSRFEIKIGNHPALPIVKHPSGCLLFIAGYKEVRVFDFLSLSFIRRLSVGPGDIKSQALSPDGKTLVITTTGGVFPFALHEQRQASPHINSEVLWQVMGSENHWEAYQAAWALAKRPDFLTFLQSNLKPALQATPEEIDFLKTQLIDGNHGIRQTAARAWLDRGLTLDRKTYETLREGGLPVAVPSKFFHPDDYPFLAAHRGVAPIPLLTPLSGHRRAMRAVMILMEDRRPESLRLLEQLAAGDPTAPLTVAAKKAVAFVAARPKSH